MTNYLILDTETTDKVNGECIELGFIEGEAWPPSTEAVSGGVYRFKPRKPISLGALATHHILPSELENRPPSHEAPHILPASSYWIGHNIDFDWRVLGSPPEVKRICTLALARVVWPKLDSYSLTAITYALFGATPEVRARVKEAHGAYSDVLLCRSILDRILAERPAESLEALWLASEDARIPRTFSFGKFRDQPIAAADRGYANWYRKQPDPDPYYIEAFRRAGLI